MSRVTKGLPPKHYVDAAGKYLGTFSAVEYTDGEGKRAIAAPTLPEGAIEVATQPFDARQKWNGTAWDAAPAIVPEAISKLQLARALRAVSKWGQVKAAIAQQSADVKEDWDLAYQINRADPLVVSLATGLGMTSGEMDAVFINGSKL